MTAQQNIPANLAETFMNDLVECMAINGIENTKLLLGEKGISYEHASLYCSIALRCFAVKNGHERSDVAMKQLAALAEALGGTLPNEQDDPCLPCGGICNGDCE